MQRVWKRLILSAVAGASLCCVAPVRHASRAADATPQPAFQWTGVAGCAAAACHGMPGPGGTKSSEYTTWMGEDPHSKAYLALFNARSRHIQKNLKLEEAKAPENALCLKCHAMNPPQTFRGPRFLVEDGVGCESCHGAAEKWVGLHHLPGWAAKSVEEKKALGMKPTKSLLERAKACAECHVGGADREVNHDLIAAGHPRLNFEFGTYLANLPKHWQEKGENARPDFEARAWSVGQIVSLDAALGLLEARATAAGKSDKKDAPLGERPVWPEFAEYDCFACHHGLRDDEWRRGQDFSKRRPGSYPWSSWYAAMAPALARLSGSEAGSSVTAINELATLMSSIRPDHAKVSAKAKDARGAIAPWVQAVNNKEITPDTVSRMLSALAADDARLAGAGWDNSAQLYLSLAALHQAQRSAASAPRGQDVLGALRKLYDGLAFKPGFNSPTEFKADDFKSDLESLQKLLRREGK